MTDRHVPHFQEELDHLKARLLEMGGLAEDRLRRAVRGLVDRDPAVLEQVLAGDGAINELHIEAGYKLNGQQLFFPNAQGSKPS